jgi:hypothetical protein
MHSDLTGGHGGICCLWTVLGAEDSELSFGLARLCLRFSVLGVLSIFIF